MLASERRWGGCTSGSRAISSTSRWSLAKDVPFYPRQPTIACLGTGEANTMVACPSLLIEPFHRGVAMLLRMRTAGVIAISLFLLRSLTADELPRLTTLVEKDAKFLVPDKHYVVLQRGDVRAVIVDNEAVDDDVLPGHRAGYSGVASLTHTNRDANLFVPAYAGLNFEHIHDGTEQPRDVLFEPRRAPMELRVIDEHTVEIYQPPTLTWKLESCSRYHLLVDGTIELSFECIPRAKTFTNGYIGLFWASYIHQPESLDIHFQGYGVDEVEKQRRWIRGVTPSHGVRPTHLASADERIFAHDGDFSLSLVFNRSQHRYTQPWYYGVSHKMALAQMFRPVDQIRITQSPSGGGQGNPAWDFQFFIPDYQVNQRYQMVMRAKYLPFESRDQIQRETAEHRTALAQ